MLKRGGLFFVFAIIALTMGAMILRRSNQSFILFTKIRDEQLNFYLNHFRVINTRSIAFAEEETLHDFYEIFANPEHKLRNTNDVEQQKSKRFKEPVKSPITLWTLRFLSLIGLFMVVFAIKHFILQDQMTKIYNTYEMVKRICFFQAYTGASFQALTNHMVIKKTESSQTDHLLEMENYYKILVPRLEELMMAFKILPQAYESSPIKGAIPDYFIANGCDHGHEESVLCNSTFVKNLMENGIRANVALIKNTLRSAVVFFSEDSVGMDTSENKNLLLIINSIAKVFYILFP